MPVYSAALPPAARAIARDTTVTGVLLAAADAAGMTSGPVITLVDDAHGWSAMLAVPDSVLRSSGGLGVLLNKRVDVTGFLVPDSRSRTFRVTSIVVSRKP